MKISPSSIGRLLEEISWEGNARKYRQGGRGFENVLTAEAFQALDFLPRSSFLGRIIASLEGGDPETLRLLSEQIEHTTFSLLPGGIFLSEGSSAGEPPLEIQPDGILESPSVYCLLEVKRIKPAYFQAEQLSREYLTALQEAEDRRPLLLLVLPKPPPVLVKGHGRMSLREAVAQSIQAVLDRAEAEFPPAEELVQRVDAVFAYTTWARVQQDVEAAVEDFAAAAPSLRASISRVAKAVTSAIQWHS